MHRQGKLQRIDASSFWQKLRKSLGSKRKKLSPEHIEEITRLFGECRDAYFHESSGEISSRHIPCAVRSPNPASGGRQTESACNRISISRIFKNEDFGHRTITVERPERDAAGQIVTATKGKLKGNPQPDASLRDPQNVPMGEDVDTYIKREVLPHAPDAWIDHEKSKVGYEIPFNRHVNWPRSTPN